MRGVKRCQESTGRMKKHRYSNEFKVTAVKMANAPAVPTSTSITTTAYTLGLTTTRPKNMRD